MYIFKARQQIGTIHHKFYRYPEQLYTCGIHLEHATPVWDPHLFEGHKKPESIQLFACRRRVCTKRWDDAYILHTLNIYISHFLKGARLFMGSLVFPNAPLAIVYMPCKNRFTGHTYFTVYLYNLGTLYNY